MQTSPESPTFAAVSGELVRLRFPDKRHWQERKEEKFMRVKAGCGKNSYPGNATQFQSTLTCDLWDSLLRQTRLMIIPSADFITHGLKGDLTQLRLCNHRKSQEAAKTYYMLQDPIKKVERNRNKTARERLV